MPHLIVCGAKWTICSQILAIKELQYVAVARAERLTRASVLGSYTCTCNFKALYYSSQYSLYQMNNSKEKSLNSNESFDGF